MLFVRHTLPGERVLARVTETGAGERFVRADAVEVRQRVARPGRAAVPVRRAGPVRRVRPPARRPAAPARAQGRRRARADGPAGAPRRRRRGRAGARATTTASTGAPGSSSPSTPRGGPGCAGTARTTSSPVDHCRIAAPGIDRLRVTERPWPGVEAGRRRRARPSASRSPCVAARRPTCRSCASGSTAAVAGARRRRAPLGRASSRSRPAASGRCTPAPPDLRRGRHGGRRRARPGERALDLYAGVGPVRRRPRRRGGRRRARCSPSSPTPGRPSTPASNLADRPNVAVLTARVDDAFGVARPSRRGSARQRGSRPRKASRSALMPTSADVVVLDPPRTGAGRGVCAEVAALRPRVVVYVACDPAALARDTAYLAEPGLPARRRCGPSTPSR